MNIKTAPNFGGNLSLSFVGANIKIDNFDENQGRSRKDSLFTGLQIPNFKLEDENGQLDMLGGS